MNENKNKTSKKPLFKTIVIIAIIFIFVFIVARYTTDEDFRSYINVNILRKEVSEASLTTIELDSDSNPTIYAYDKYISVLSKNTLTSYTSSGKVSSELSVNISVPLVETNGKYLVLAEQNGDRIYLISGSNILWQKTVDISLFVFE